MPYEEAFYIPPKNKSGHQSWVRKGEQRNRPRAPQPGQGSMRVTNGDEAIWLSSDPRSRKDPTPKPSRFASVIEEARRPVVPPDDPLFRRDAERVRRAAAGMDVVPPRPAPGPRREATPYTTTPGYVGPANHPRDYPSHQEEEEEDIAARVGRFRQQEAGQDQSAADLMRDYWAGREATPYSGGSDSATAHAEAAARAAQEAQEFFDARPNPAHAARVGGAVRARSSISRQGPPPDGRRAPSTSTWARQQQDLEMTEWVRRMMAGR